MITLTSVNLFGDNVRTGALVVLLIIVLAVVTGFQRIKKIVAYLLMALYEFFIQKNAVKL